MIEELLQEQLGEDTLLGSALAQYGGEPAIFCQKAPTDDDPNWQGMSFPRIHYNLDFSFDPERKQAGTLTIDIWACSLNPSPDGRNLDRVLANHVEELVSAVFYTPKEGIPLCAIWRDSVAFLGKATDTNRENSPVETFGISVTFDLIAFPPQDSFSPDPILGLATWAKARFPLCKVIGFDEIPPIWRPSDLEPALYWRMAGADIRRELFACTWYLGEFFAHISCDSVETRNHFARAICEEIRGGFDLVLEDGSFLRMEKSLYRHDGNPLSQGQVALWGEFGVLAPRVPQTTQGKPLHHVNFTIGGCENAR